MALALAAVIAAGFAIASRRNGGGSDSQQPAGVATSLAPVRRTTLSAQTQASGTIGYADPAEIAALGQGGVFTWLPDAGDVIRRGRRLYSVDGNPALLLYGSTPAWREFRLGMSDGRDVAELNRNLRALGYHDAPSGDSFTDGTRRAIEQLQDDRGLSETGVLTLGSVVFRPGRVRVASVLPSVGTPVQPGASVMTVTSTRHEVDVQLDPSQQGNVHVGDRVRVTLPDNTTTAGVISRIGTVSSSSSTAGDGRAAPPMLDLTARLLHPAAAGRLDQAPVELLITTATAKDVLVVPVTALVAQGGGRYAVEVADTAGGHHLVPVELGLFDDADGLVEVTGSGLRAGRRVVVPSL
ncbi:MAG TPA: HlyD family efflux transporter periplasmic adaptor subunit [Gaiellaceae bacterium]|nr:HlyD family efflux transporter periplasmic adaptor subunit [Gaiellaceae bacterium]